MLVSKARPLGCCDLSKRLCIEFCVVLFLSLDSVVLRGFVKGFLNGDFESISSIKEESKILEPPPKVTERRLILGRTEG